MIKFADIPLRPEIFQALDKLGFEHPTPIQARIIEQFSEERRDIIGVAQTGTGKTAAFSIPILETVVPMTPVVQALVLSPTRELAVQISKDIESYAAFLKGVNTTVVYGGASIMQQIKELKSGIQIVIGTPGRVKDLINRKKLDLSGVDWLVLDEADEMLSMGFKDDLDFILSQTPDDKTTMLFSATFPKEIQNIAKKHLTDPVEIRVSAKNETAKNIRHSYYLVRKSSKYEALKRLLDMHLDIYAIVFCRTRSETSVVAKQLGADGYNADVLNGDLSQSQRDQVMERFRDRQLQILVATDVAARGLDVDSLSHVIHYQLPDDQEVYIHRSGRTGRAGNEGESVSILSPSDMNRLKSLEHVIGKSIEQKRLPRGIDICKNRVLSFVHNLRNAEVRHHQIKQLMPESEAILMDLSKEELIEKVVSLEFKMFLEYYENEEDINVDARDARRSKEEGKKARKSRDREDAGRTENFNRYFLNIGTDLKLKPKTLIQLINQSVGDRDINIGHIDIMKDFSFFEADASFHQVLIKGMKNASYRNHRINVELALQEKPIKKSRGKSRKFRSGKPSRRRK